jgi:hypothetical protein
MTSDEFNEKYKAFLEEGHYGLSFDNERVTDMLDNIFKDLTLIPGFQYSQIKLKFGMPRFYSNLNSTRLMYMIEQEINEIVNKSFNG